MLTNCGQPICTGVRTQLEKDNINTIRSHIKRSPLVAFFLLALILPWIGGPLSNWIYNGIILSIVFALPVASLVASPLLTALIVTR